MRRYFVGVFLCCAFAAQAADTLRVGSAVLVVGDPVTRVKALLGEPTHKGTAGRAVASKTHSSGTTTAKARTRKAKGRASSKAKLDKSAGDKAASKGETWQYRRGGHTTLITIADGRVAAIEDIPR